MRALTKIMLMAAFAVLAVGCGGDDLQCVGCDDSTISSDTGAGNFSSSSEPNGGTSSSGGKDDDVRNSSSGTETDGSSSSGGKDNSSSSSTTGGGNSSSSDGANDYYRYYDPYTAAAQRCQGGFVEYKCGEEWYMPGTGTIDNNGIYLYQYCSSNAIVKTEIKYERCGSNWYSPATTTRCQDGVVENKCGEEWYKGTINDNGIGYTCSNNASKVLDKCEGSTYNPTSYFCYDNKRYSLCGDSKLEYNPETQRCSSGAVETKCGTGSNYHNPATEGCCGDNKYSISTQFCSSIDNKVYYLCGGSGGSQYNPETQRCSSDAIQQQCGTTWYNIETYFCSDKNIVYSKCGGNVYTSSQYCGNGVVKNYTSITDARDGKKYNTTVIGTQTWMAENLNYGGSDNSIGSCFNNDPNNCEYYGRNYHWSTAMNGSGSSTANPSGVQGICPAGWHIPSNAECTTLETYVRGTDNYGLGMDCWWSTSDGRNSGYAYIYCTDGSGLYDYQKGTLETVRCVQD